MPPKKKLSSRGMTTIDSSGPDPNELSVAGNSSFLKRSSKLSSLIGKTKKSNGNSSSFYQNKSSSTDLENDDGFLFKRAGKPLLNKSNLLDSISELRKGKNDESVSLISNKKRSRSQNNTDQRKKQKKESTPVRLSPRAKKLRIIPKSSGGSSKLLDMESDSSDLENTLEPLSQEPKINKSLKKSNNSGNILNGGSSLKKIEKSSSKKPKTTSNSIINGGNTKSINKSNSSKKEVKETKSKSTSKKSSTAKQTKAKSIQKKPTSKNLKLNNKTKLSVSQSKEDEKKVYGSPGEKEPLQISESPINRRNKELRANNNRRSSIGNRGKRTSSIGNGFEVAPHDDVLPSNFFKHLNQDLPEPHRMRQLLTWCFKRQLDYDKKIFEKKKRSTSLKKQNSEDMIANNIAKVIKEEIFRDLVDGKVSTSWWNRGDDDDDEESKKEKIVIVPNQQNVDNAKALKVFQSRVTKLKKENDEWDKVAKEYEDRDKLLGSDQFAINETSEEQVEFIKRKASDSKNVAIEKLLEKADILDDQFNKISSTITEDIENNYEEGLSRFSNFADKLNFNDSIIKTFEYNRKKQIAKIIKDYIQISSIETDTPEDSTTAYQFDDIELLKGITKIDKP